jgi:hypothetical protein
MTALQEPVLLIPSKMIARVDLAIKALVYLGPWVCAGSVLGGILSGLIFALKK